jgi:hypothetical protein
MLFTVFYDCQLLTSWTFLSPASTVGNCWFLIEGRRRDAIEQSICTAGCCVRAVIGHAAAQRKAQMNRRRRFGPVAIGYPQRAVPRLTNASTTRATFTTARPSTVT